MKIYVYIKSSNRFIFFSAHNYLYSNKFSKESEIDGFLQYHYGDKKLTVAEIVYPYKRILISGKIV